MSWDDFLEALKLKNATVKSRLVVSSKKFLISPTVKKCLDKLP